MTADPMQTDQPNERGLDVVRLFRSWRKRRFLRARAERSQEVLLTDDELMERLMSDPGVRQRLREAQWTARYGREVDPPGSCRHGVVVAECSTCYYVVP